MSIAIDTYINIIMITDVTPAIVKFKFVMNPSFGSFDFRLWSGFQDNCINV